MTSRILKLVPLAILLCSAVLAAAVIPTVLVRSVGLNKLEVHMPQADTVNPFEGDPVPGGGTPTILIGLG